jgi:hypothetical protein
MAERETIIEVPKIVRPVTHVRSTLIQSSLKQLKEHGHFDAYERSLPPASRSTILETLGPTWLSIELAVAHYQTCEALQLTAAERLRIGEAVGARMNSTLIGTLARVAKLSGLTPWGFYGQLERLWRRAFQGGAIGLQRLGPNQSSIEVRGLTLCRYEYFRDGFAGVITSIANLAAADATTIVVEHGPDMLRLRGTWDAGASGRPG